MINSIFVMPSFRDSGGACNRHRKIFRNGEIGKNLLSLGHQRDAAAGDVMRRQVLESRAFE